MLKTEIKNTAQYYQRKQLIVIQVINSMATKCDAYSRGAISLLQNMRCVVDKLHKDCLDCLNLMNVQPPSSTEYENSDDDSVDSSDESIDFDSDDYV